MFSLLKKSSVACFGEILLRLSTPDSKKFLQSNSLDLNVGGAECNLAINLSSLGISSSMITILPESILGEYVLQTLKRHGVTIDNIAKSQYRMGTYILEGGLPNIKSNILYDRQDSCFSKLKTDQFDWLDIVKENHILHISGINLAISDEAAKASIMGARTAFKNNRVVSFDSNFRPSLWLNNTAKARDLLKNILKFCTIVYITEQDINFIFELKNPTKHSPKSNIVAYAKLFKEFPNLKFLASTSRKYDRFGQLSYRGVLANKHAHCFSNYYHIPYSIDRVGSGDAFAAGILFGLINEYEEQRCVEFATALATVKHSIVGDFAAVNRQTVFDTMDNNCFSVKR